MSYQAESYIPATPYNDLVTGKFCYPYPFGAPGAISTDPTKPRPLSVGTDITVTENAGYFEVDSNVGSIFLNWGVNVGDKVSFVDTGNVPGTYTVKSVDSDTKITLYGPAVTLTQGIVFFVDKPQPIQGVDTNFKKYAKKGDYLVLMNDSFTPTVQVAKVLEVTDDTNILVYGGFIGDLSSLPVLICRTSLLGVSINCGGAGVVNGKAVEAGDIPTYYQATGLDPVYGDAGGSNFKIITQN